MRFAEKTGNLSAASIIQQFVQKPVEFQRVGGMADAVMRSVMERMAGVLRSRVGDAMRVEAVMFCCDEGLIGATPGARELMREGSMS